jgi:hypothetical protein
MCIDDDDDDTAFGRRSRRYRWGAICCYRYWQHLLSSSQQQPDEQPHNDRCKTESIPRRGRCVRVQYQSLNLNRRYEWGSVVAVTVCHGWQYAPQAPWLLYMLPASTVLTLLEGVVRVVTGMQDGIDVTINSYPAERHICM